MAPLYGGRAEEAQAWSADVGGLRFVGIDNSHYQVTPEQTRVLQTALELQPEEGQEVSSSKSPTAAIPQWSTALARRSTDVHIPLWHIPLWHVVLTL